MAGVAFDRHDGLVVGFVIVVFGVVLCKVFSRSTQTEECVPERPELECGDTLNITRLINTGQSYKRHFAL